MISELLAEDLFAMRYFTILTLKMMNIPADLCCFEKPQRAACFYACFIDHWLPMPNETPCFSHDISQYDSLHKQSDFLILQ